RLEPRARHLEFTGARDLEPVETTRVLEERGVAARAHVVEDFAHAPVDLGVRRRLPGEQALEILMEVGGGAVEPAYPDHDGTASPMRRIRSFTFPCFIFMAALLTM